MSKDSSRAMLWKALALGPRWVLRGSAVQLASQEASDLSADADPSMLDWDALEVQAARCTRCSLCHSRKQAVFGVGDRQASWLIVGEAPGEREDALGEPFVGQAGKLLDNMLAAVGRSRGQTGRSGVYIANVLKCRPPGNRNPLPEEVQACSPYLMRQIALLQPEVIVVMGRFAAQAILGSDASIASLRSRVHVTQLAGRSIPVVVTYHPAYLLRNLADKAKSWQDLQLACRAPMHQSS